MKIWIFTFVLPVLAICLPTSPAWALDRVQWDQLQTRIQTQGKPMETEAGTYMSLSHVTPDDRTKPRQAEYISDVGYEANGKYVPYTVSVVSENWSINADGDWDIDQWIYAASVDGDLRNAFHVHILETKDSMVKDSTYTPIKDLASPEMVARWAAVLNPWLAGTY